MKEEEEKSTNNQDEKWNIKQAKGESRKCLLGSDTIATQTNTLRTDVRGLEYSKHTLQAPLVAIQNNATMLNLMQTEKRNLI